jgi:hypothetical protein
MIRHVVVFRWNESVTDEQLASRCPMHSTRSPVRSPRSSPTATAAISASAPANFDYSITADFANVEDFAVYRDHPEHQRFIAEHITGRVSERVAVQFEYED